jgi:hypothetical protein
MAVLSDLAIYRQLASIAAIVTAKDVARKAIDAQRTQA